MALARGRPRAVRALSSLLTQLPKAQAAASGNRVPACARASSTLSLGPEHAGQTVAEAIKPLVPAGAARPFAFRTPSGSILSLSSRIEADADLSSLEAITFDSSHPAARHAFWLSSAYLLAMALIDTLTPTLGDDRLVLAAAPTLVPAGGFAYEYLLADQNQNQNHATETEPSVSALISNAHQPRLSEQQMRAVEKRVSSLAASNLSFATDAISLQEANRIFSHNPFKLDLARTLAARNDGRVPIVRVGDSFLDLVPLTAEPVALLPSSRPIKALQLTHWSAATWTPADPASTTTPPLTQALTRLGGVSFPTPAALKAHLAQRAAALAADHRNIGRAQSLFLAHESSPGTPFILPHGMRLARKVERVIRDLYDVFGYDEVQSPQLYRSSLWKTSGHWDNYRDDMFTVQGYREQQLEKEQQQHNQKGAEAGCAAHSHSHHMPQGGEAESFGLKPMNCPGHCLIFASTDRSYRDLPIRYAEFSPLHRNESSGSLTGLTRVRRFHQDDAHVFCRPDQVESEIASMLTMLTSAYATFGFTHYELVLSTRPGSFIGSTTDWDRAELALRSALDQTGRSWTLNEGDGAFYGPKIDIRLIDAAGRRHQTATIQLDFQLPQRFDLSYSAASGSGARERPVMIHRAILGSVERFMAILIEQTAGWWPFWLSPRQAVILPASSDTQVVQYADELRTKLALGPAPGTGTGTGARAHLHVDVDQSNDKLAKRVRRAQMARYNLILVVGDKEVQSNTVNVRLRDDSNAPARIRDARAHSKIQINEGAWNPEHLRERMCLLASLQAW